MNGLCRRSKPILNPRETITGNNSFYSLLSVETCSWTKVWNLPTGKGCLSIWLPFHNLSYIGQSYCLCLQIVWQPTRRRMSDGVLGSPPRNEFRGIRTNPNQIGFDKCPRQETAPTAESYPILDSFRRLGLFLALDICQSRFDSGLSVCHEIHFGGGSLIPRPTFVVGWVAIQSASRGSRIVRYMTDYGMAVK